MKLDLPIPLLDRLLASRIVPLQAKIRAIDSWQDELTEANSDDPRVLELRERLAMAHAFLKNSNGYRRSSQSSAFVSRRGPAGRLSSRSASYVA